MEKTKFRKRWISDWWPNRLDLKILKQNYPNWYYGEDFDYLEEVSIRFMGVKTIGFGLGREDVFEPDESPDWGEEEMLSAKGRFEDDNLREPYSATEMGLIYVNPADQKGCLTNFITNRATRFRLEIRLQKWKRCQYVCFWI